MRIRAIRSDGKPGTIFETDDSVAASMIAAGRAEPARDAAGAVKVATSAEEPELVSPQPSDSDWIDDLTVEDLKSELDGLGLARSGNKAELAKRLRDAVEG